PHVLTRGAHTDAAVPVQPEGRAPALPSLIALALVELADQEQPPAHPRRQMGGTFTDLCLEALEGYLDRCQRLFCHVSEYTKHMFDLAYFRGFSFRSEDVSEPLRQSRPRPFGKVTAATSTRERWLPARLGRSIAASPTSACHPPPTRCPHDRERRRLDPRRQPLHPFRCRGPEPSPRGPPLPSRRSKARGWATGSTGQQGGLLEGLRPAPMDCPPWSRVDARCDAVAVGMASVLLRRNHGPTCRGARERLRTQHIRA